MIDDGVSMHSDHNQDLNAHSSFSLLTSPHVNLQTSSPSFSRSHVRPEHMASARPMMSPQLTHSSSFASLDCREKEMGSDGLSVYANVAAHALISALLCPSLFLFTSVSVSSCVTPLSLAFKALGNYGNRRQVAGAL